MTKFAAVLTIVAAIGLDAGAATAAEPQGHAPTGEGGTVGGDFKWPTDGEVRHGMSEIRALLAAALPQLRGGHLGGPERRQLAKGILGQVEAINAHNRLPMEANDQLAGVLAQLADAAQSLEAGDPGRDDVARMIAGMDAYGRRFDHAGWQPLDH